MNILQGEELCEITVSLWPPSSSDEILDSQRRMIAMAISIMRRW